MKIEGSYITNEFICNKSSMFKYFPIQRTSFLDNRLVRFTLPLALNDPFESYQLFNSYTAQSIGDLNYQFILDKHPLNKWGIFSLSKNPFSILMWSHYSSDHKGFVVEFDTTHEFFKFDKNTFSNYIQYSDNLIELSEIEKKSFNHDEGNICNFPFKVLLQKHSDWKYEQEFRVFKNIKNAKETISIDKNGFHQKVWLDIHLFEIPASAIKSIIIGANADETIEMKIKDKLINCKEYSHIRLFYSVLRKNIFEIVFKESSISKR